ncbi:hypothetical protein DFH06DRAFT_1210240 [Mycena polygramma]|nr:hypothetical protein DFH06DRAFT_1210240 [Mycena polygramma]
MVLARKVPPRVVTVTIVFAGGSTYDCSQRIAVAIHIAKIHRWALTYCTRDRYDNSLWSPCPHDFAFMINPNARRRRSSTCPIPRSWANHPEG